MVELTRQLNDAHLETAEMQGRLNTMRKEGEEQSAKMRDIEESQEQLAAQHNEDIGQKDERIGALEAELSKQDSELETARKQETQKVEALGEEHLQRQRELIDLRTRQTEHTQLQETLRRQLDDEKEATRHVLQMLDDSRDENIRKEEASTELYTANEDARARLATLESQSAQYMKMLQAKEDEIEASERERRSLQISLEEGVKEVETAREKQRSSEQRANDTDRDLRLKEQRCRDLEFELERTQSDVEHRVGNQKSALSGAEEEAAMLQQRLVEAERKIVEVLRMKDEGNARMRAAELRVSELERAPPRRLGVTTGNRSASPGVIELLHQAAEGGTSAARGRGGAGTAGLPYKAQSSWNIQRAMCLMLIALFVLVGMYHAQWSSGIVQSTQEIDLQKSVTHLRALLTSQETALTNCREKCLPKE